MSHADPITASILDPPPTCSPRLVLTSPRQRARRVWWPRTTACTARCRSSTSPCTTPPARIARVVHVGTGHEATKIWTPLGVVKVGWFITSLHPRDVDLSLTDNRRVVLRVIAPDTPAREGEACLRLAEEARTALAPHDTTRGLMPEHDPDPGPADGSSAVHRVRMLVNPVERAQAANRLQRSFARGSVEAARLRQEALRAAREDLTVEQLAAALRLPVARVHAMLNSTDAGADRPWGP